MISYPGEILRRFGRYEAVQEIERAGIAQLWGAWDPFLERFVIVVELPGLDPRDLLEGLRTLAEALERWTEARVRGDEVVLDFDPGEGERSAYFVVAAEDDDGESGDDGDETVDEPAGDDDPEEAAAGAGDSAEDEMPDSDETVAGEVWAASQSHATEAVAARRLAPRETSSESETQRPLLLLAIISGLILMLAGLGFGIWWGRRSAPAVPPAAARPATSSAADHPVGG